VKLRARHAGVVVIGMAVVLAGLAAPAVAAPQPPAVTLNADPSYVSFGGATALSGRITPWHKGETVRIVDGSGRVVTTATTVEQGKYSAAIAPRANVWLHAEHNGARSRTIEVHVRPRISASLSGVAQFSTASVRGKLAPLRPGATVSVTLLHGWKPIAHQGARVSRSGTFEARFAIRLSGVYRARVAFDAPDLEPAAALTGPATTPALPTLQVGSKGPAVRLLERRLVALHYRLIEVDRVYDYRTADAVLAFRKVQGLARVTTVDSAVWSRLASPRAPAVHVKTKGRHIEVNQTLQVLMVVVDGKTRYIIHVSTGKPSTPTHDGSFQVYRKLAGYSANHLYYPSYFDGHRAIHGWTEVPPYAASHGCVRIPYWNATWMFGLDPVGTRVIVYH
jgi:lipoprotein-anchoring transpeptidase ErfK/SrfK